MVSNGLQVFGFVLGVMSWIGMIGTCASPEWRKNTHGQTLIDNTLRYEGLWVRCKAFSTGQTHCDDYNTFFIGLPDVLQKCRGLIISSITLGFVAIVVTIFGLKCVSVGGGNSAVKAKVAMVGGVLFGVAGILVGAAVSLYAQDVVQEYYNPLLRKDLELYLRFEYGNALFIGWASLVFGILSGVLICACSAYILSRARQVPPHVHEFHPVSILQKQPQEHVPLHVLPAERSSNASSTRHVTIDHQQRQLQKRQQRPPPQTQISTNGKHSASSQNGSSKLNSITPSSERTSNEGTRRKRRRRRSFSDERKPRSRDIKPQVYNTTKPRSNRRHNGRDNDFNSTEGYRQTKQYV